MLLLAVNWIAEWNWTEKWQRLKKHKSALFWLLFLLVLCLGFVKADDASAALDNFATKLPLCLAPVIVATSKKMNFKELAFALGIFIVSVLSATIYSVCYYASHEITNIREISPFISHIRFSLCIDISIVLLFSVVLSQNKIKRIYRLVSLSVACWLVLYLFVAQTLTGILLLAFVVVVYSVCVLCSRNYMRKKKIYAGAFLSVWILALAYVVVISYQYFHVDQKDYQHLEPYTVNHHPYSHDLNSMVENGSYIGVYVCEEELRSAWNRRSTISYDDPLIAASLIRYLNSLHLRKDSAAVMSLSDWDVHQVEQYVANVDYTRKLGLKRALYPMFFSMDLYSYNGTLTHSSLLKRWLAWKASMKLMAQYPLWGVGLGNQKQALMEVQMVENQTFEPIPGCHNQFLTFGLIAGVFAIAAFVFLLAYPFFEQKGKMTFVYIAFFIILVGSMFTEDTLETQAGYSLFAVLNALILYGYNLRKYEDA